jgi:diamine N-acetyltransferase
VANARHPLFQIAHYNGQRGHGRDAAVRASGGVGEESMVSIRAADLRDAEVLADLSRRTFHDTFAAHNKPEDMDAYMSEAFTVERIAAAIRQPGTVWLLAETPTRVVGFAMLAPEPPPACVTARFPVRLAKLYVSADAMGSGVGAALMRAGIAWATTAGYKSLWLGVWEHNHRANAFYARWGFVPVGAEVFRLGSDDQTDVLMQLELPGKTG